MAISTDSIYSHKVFAETSPSLRQATYPLLSDRSLEVSRIYGVLDENTGAAFRATLLIDPEGIIVSKVVYPKEVGRNMPEMVRLLQAVQFRRETGLGVSANWVPGMPGIPLSLNNAGKF